MRQVSRARFVAASRRRRVVFIGEHATNRRLHTERCVVIPRNSLPVRNLGLTVGNEIQSDISKREDVGHWSLLLSSR